MTSEKSFISRGLSSFNSWGRKCDKTVFACNCAKIKKIVESNKYENIFHGLIEMQIMQLDIVERYSEMVILL